MLPDTNQNSMIAATATTPMIASTRLRTWSRIADTSCTGPYRITWLTFSFSAPPGSK